VLGFLEFGHLSTFHLGGVLAEFGVDLFSVVKASMRSPT